MGGFRHACGTEDGAIWDLRPAGSPERAPDDLEHVLRPRVRLHALELSAHERAASRLQAAPLVEARDHARRDLRVERVELEDDAGEQLVAGAVLAVEANLVRHREGSDERADAVRVLEREVGMPEER